MSMRETKKRKIVRRQNDYAVLETERERDMKETKCNDIDLFDRPGYSRYSSSSPSASSETEALAARVDLRVALVPEL